MKQRKVRILLFVSQLIIFTTCLFFIFHTWMFPYFQKGSEYSSSFYIFGYYVQYSTSDQNSFQSLSHYSHYLNGVGFATFTLNEGGELQGITPHEGIQVAQKKGKDTFLTIQNEYDKERVHNLLSDESKRKKIIQVLIRKASALHFSGININFENIEAGDRPLFSLWIKELKESLSSHNLKLMVSVHAKTEDNPNAVLEGAFDYQEIGKWADYVQLMTYDEHGKWGEAGPVASLPWVENVIHYTLDWVSPSKILLGIPTYGYDWNQTTKKGHRALSWVEVVQKMGEKKIPSSWSEKWKSPYFSYQDEDGNQREVWFENQQSIQEKIHLAKTYQLGGVSIWRIGLEDEDFWKGVSLASHSK